MSMTLDISLYPHFEILHKTSSLRSHLFFPHAVYADHTRLPWNLHPLLHWHLPYMSGFVKCSCFALFFYYVRSLTITFSYAFPVSSIVPNTEVLLNDYLLVNELILLTLLVAAYFPFSLLSVQCNYWWLEMTAATWSVGVLKSGMGLGMRRKRKTCNQIFRQLPLRRRESQTTDSNSFSLNKNSFALFLLVSFFSITMRNLGKTSGMIVIFQPSWHYQEIVILVPRQAMTPGQHREWSKSKYILELWHMILFSFCRFSSSPIILNLDSYL